MAAGRPKLCIQNRAEFWLQRDDFGTSQGPPEASKTPYVSKLSCCRPARSGFDGCHCRHVEDAAPVTEGENMRLPRRPDQDRPPNASARTFTI